jgi:flagellum-specific peptidoglycan hydrolase FlgJ
LRLDHIGREPNFFIEDFADKPRADRTVRSYLLSPRRPVLHFKGAVQMPTATELGWLRTMVAPAQMSQQKWGVPTSVTLAQCIVESGWGTSALARKNRNYFGVKAVVGEAYCEYTTDEDFPSGTVAERAKFAVYPTAIESFDAHGRLLATLPRYAAAMKVCDDAALFCWSLQEGGYSTSRDPLTHKLNYAQRLVNDFILPLKLMAYDLPPEPIESAKVQQEAA